MISSTRYLARVVGKCAQYRWVRWAPALSPDEFKLTRVRPPVFVNSVPKAGTNLLRRLVGLSGAIVPRWTYHLDRAIPGSDSQLSRARGAQLVTAHDGWTPEREQTIRDRGFVSLLMVRDIRDVVRSDVNYITYMDPSHPLHARFKSLPTMEERVREYLYPSDQTRASMPRHWWSESGYERFLGWREVSNCLVVRFEDLVGPQGGGDAQLQESTVTQILAHLGMPREKERVAHLCRSLFGQGGRTFSRGQIAGWRLDLCPEAARLVTERHREFLQAFAYECSV